jgi:hypothetical protein
MPVSVVHALAGVARGGCLSDFANDGSFELSGVEDRDGGLGKGALDEDLVCREVPSSGDMQSTSPRRRQFTRMQAQEAHEMGTEQEGSAISPWSTR